MSDSLTVPAEPGSASVLPLGRQEGLRGAWWPSHGRSSQTAASEGAVWRVQSRAMLLAVAAGAVTLLAVIGLFLRLMNYELRKDEQLYVPPARLLDDLNLYQDFFYNHTPGAAWWFHAVRQALGSDHILFDARVGVFLAWLLFAASIGGLAYVLTRSAWIGWSIAVISLVNELFLTQTGLSATNNFLPLPLSFLGLGLFVLALTSERPPRSLVFLSGLLLAAAMVFKISAGAFVLPAAAGALLLPRHLALRERLRRMVLPLAAGGIVGGLPVIVLLVTAPGRFLAHVVGYHLGPHAQYFREGSQADEGAVMTLPGKIMLAHELWLGGTVALGIAALGVVLALWMGGRRPGGWWDALVFAAVAFVVAAAFAFLPAPSFPQYFAPPLICLPLALIVLVAGLAPVARGTAASVLAVVAVVALVAQAPRLFGNLGSIASPGRWTVSRVHEGGVEMAQRLAQAKLEGKVATLAPVYPLEGGLAVYPEFATGPFLFRTADLATPDLARFYRMVSPAGLAELFDADPPAAFLLGFDAELEKPLLDYATAHGYRPLPDFELRDRYGTGLLYLPSPG